MFKFILLGFCFLLSSCNNSLVKKEKRINPKAVSYIDSATKVLLTTGDYQKAIKLTELAIAIDSDFVSAYEHLFGYCLILKEYDKALKTSLKLNKIRPYRADFISSTGLVFFFMHDTLNGKKYLQKSTLVYQNIVDTLKRDKYPKEYFDIKSAQAFNLIFYDNITSEKMYALLYAEADSSQKINLDFYRNKSAAEVIKILKGEE